MSKKGIKILSVFVGVLLAVSMVGGVANAQTSNDATIAALLAQIQSLQAQLIALQGGGSTTGYVFTRDLTIGSTGADVTALQNFLIAKGYQIPAGATGYFGLQTRGAVSAFQSAKGISPIAGYFGPITRAAVMAMGGTTPVPPGTPGTPITPVTGNAGSISDADFLSGLSGEEVGENASDVAVAGLKIEADEGSDILLTAVRLVFNEGTANQDFDEYATDVSLWFNGKKVAQMDASSFDEDNAWSQTISISDSSAIIKAGLTGELVVKVSGISNLDSDDDGETWTIEFNSIRFKDGQGATVTETAQGDIGGATRTFSFETFATAASSELKLTANNDAINDAHIIQVDATDEDVSDNVSLFAFSMEAKGDSDLKIKDFGVLASSTGQARIDALIAGGSTTPAIRLKINGSEYGTAAYNDGDGDDGTVIGEEIAFTDVDYTIPAGTKVNVIIEADILAVDTSLDIGDTIQISVGEGETDDTALVDVRDESNTQLVDADITGGPASGDHPFYSIFITPTLVSASASAANNDTAVDDDVGTFSMVFDLKATGGTAFVGDTAVGTTIADGSLTASGTTDSIEYRIYDSGTATADTARVADLVTWTTPVGVTDTGTVIQIDDGATTRATLTVTVTNDGATGGSADDGIYYMDLAIVHWGIANDSVFEYGYIYNLDNFKTSTISLN